VLNFLDRNQGLNPSNLDFSNPAAPLAQHDFDFLIDMRNNYYYALDGARFEYVLPSQLPQDISYLFNTYLLNGSDAADKLVNSGYAQPTALRYRSLAGYVDGDGVQFGHDDHRGCSNRLRVGYWKSMLGLLGSKRRVCPLPK
jgi:hypothetical protein